MSVVNWRNRLERLIVEFVLPAGLFFLLTGMFWIGDHGDFPRIFALLIALPTLLLLLLRPRTILDAADSPIIVVAAAFCAYALLSLSWATPEDSIEALAKRPLMAPVLLVAIGAIGVCNLQRLQQVVRLAAIVAIAGALYTLGRFILEGMPGRLSGYGALYNPLLVSHVFGFFTALWLGELFSGKRALPPLPIVAILACGALLLLTGSRTPLLAVSATVLWLALLSANRRALVAIAGLLGALLLVAVLWPEVLLQRGASYRPQIWLEALRQIAERPWFGHGYATPMYIQLAEFPHPFREPHNLTLAIMLQLGVVGVLGWLALYGIALVGAWRGRRTPEVLWFSAPVVYGLVAGMTEGGSFLSRPKEHWFLVWIPLALLAAVMSRRRRSDAQDAG